MSIKRYREKLGLTQPALAKRWRISRVSLKGWEEGRTLPRGKLIDSILRIEVGQLTRAELLDNIERPLQREAADHRSADHSAGQQMRKLAAAEIVEIGARTIYEFRAHPKRKIWQTLAPAAKEPYYEQMRVLVAKLAHDGFSFRLRP